MPATYPIPCPECGHMGCTVLSASMPTVYRCDRCDHSWNPNNKPKPKPKISKRELMASLGMTRAVGNQGGVFWE